MTSDTDLNSEKSDKAILEDDIGQGLTDDERLEREDRTDGEGSRVQPGPADLERLTEK
ncbi:MAG: hypothetical protein ACRYF9_21935 [Janthinobacterium lividum]